MAEISATKKKKQTSSMSPFFERAFNTRVGRTETKTKEKPKIAYCLPESEAESDILSVLMGGLNFEEIKDGSLNENIRQLLVEKYPCN